MKYREPLDLTIDTLNEDGCGLSADGQFAVYGSLPGESVTAQPLTQKRKKVFLKTIAVKNPSSERVEPHCPAAASCGGCSYQHMKHSAQLEFKSGLLRKHLLPLEPLEWLPPVTGPTLGYRSKARLGVRYVEKKGRVLVGFREKQKSYITDISACPVLSGDNADLITPLQELVGALSVARSVPQIEVAAGDEETALIIRHLEPFDQHDLELLSSFSDRYGVQIFLQPGGIKTIRRVFPDTQDTYLEYSLPKFGLDFRFKPSDFTQVNLAVNRQMVARAVELLDLRPTDGVFDAFCGIGN
ncbi:MAG: 23S rRNA (uracil(1939)-C(5))-methyltransferase, partial [Gammaproteobacteria bacterium]|nr:23S rRNA (uracil(1939)-C(5))-methyltransferase [Gammaproteobacteria bacterium]